MQEAAAKVLKRVPFKDIVPKYKNFFFDCDGVIVSPNSIVFTFL